MKDLDPEVEQAVDAICALGCDVVAAYIESLRQRQQRPEYRLLNETQRSSLLRELQSVMAVYDSKNP